MDLGPILARARRVTSIRIFKAPGLGQQRDQARQICTVLWIYPVTERNGPTSILLGAACGRHAASYKSDAPLDV